MTVRLAPYLRYYSTPRPTDDHGLPPQVLVVFDDGLAADRFLRLAEEEMKRARVQVPLWVSHRADPGSPWAAGTGLADPRRVGAGLPAPGTLKHMRGKRQFIRNRFIPHRRR